MSSDKKDLENAEDRDTSTNTALASNNKTTDELAKDQIASDESITKLQSVEDQTNKLKESTSPSSKENPTEPSLSTKNATDEIQIKPSKPAAAEQNFEKPVASATTASSISPSTNAHQPSPRPLKKARTAYFIFASEKRPELQAQHPGEGVASIARYTGQLWSALTSEQKQHYQELAAEERLLYETTKSSEEKLKQTNSSSPSKIDSASSNPSNLSTFILPVSRIRKIMKLDPEVKGISKEGIHLITKCAELFTVAIGKETVAMANMQNRRTLLPEDMAEVCTLKERFFFLREDIKDFMKDIVLEKKEKEKRKREEEEQEEKEGKKTKEDGNGASINPGSSGAGIRTLNSFWGATPSSS